MSRSPAADLAPYIKLLQAGVPPHRAAAECSRILATWTAELKDDGEQLTDPLSGLAEQMTTGIGEVHEGIAGARRQRGIELRQVRGIQDQVGRGDILVEVAAPLGSWDRHYGVTYNMMFRWFVGLSMDAPVWDVKVST